MKKIFIGNNEVFLTATSSPLLKKLEKKKIPLRRFFIERKSELVPIIEYLEKRNSSAVTILSHASSRQLEKIFFSLYKTVTAAGGVVENKQGELLMMYRRGKWDLPKGKIDRGETIKQAAKRETTEETGVGKLKVKGKIKFLNGEQSCTYHSYFLNGERALKETHWFEMVSDDKSKLVPQLEEDITHVGWFSKKEVHQKLRNSYRSVAWVLHEIGYSNEER